MKKFMLCALAILLALAFAAPADAQSRRRHGRSGGYWIEGYSGTPLEAVTNRNFGMIDGTLSNVGGGHRGRYDRRNEYRGYYRGSHDRRYSRGLSRNEAIGTVAVIGGAWAINKIVHRKDNQSGVEEPSKCFERVVKNARKQHVEMDASEALAFCSGQPVQDPTPDNQTVMPPAFMSSETQNAPRGAYIEDGKLCNDSSRPLTVLVDDKAVGVVAPREYVTLSRLPAGQVSYRY